MKRQLVFASSVALALAAGATSFATMADAAVVRHHGGGHAMGHFRGRHFGGGHRYAFHRGHGRHWAGGGWRGGYYGGYYDYCGPVQLALGLCVPYRPYYYGPFGML
ncbi:hypothetical protein A9174_30030 [Mesorhizobium loti NZP2037]|uniref:Sulfur globule protein n=1 Tax=Rhizobium loti TaxID=381 RepID=M5ANZ1_RHILI|nr:hypothetical protein [Mesorhizobium loti]ANN60529.1 hypothetical protein A9174_30030 [Mesorhizobium loti NZP2037]BAN10157.1 hypothetical protein [Mesorhizobium loti NZP2037]